MDKWEWSLCNKERGFFSTPNLMYELCLGKKVGHHTVTRYTSTKMKIQFYDTFSTYIVCTI